MQLFLILHLKNFIQRINDDPPERGKLHEIEGIGNCVEVRILRITKVQHICTAFKSTLDYFLLLYALE